TEPGGRILATIPEGECWRFITVDPAGTEAERPQASGARSWAVVQVWDQPRRELSKFLLLRHQERGQPEYASLLLLIERVYREWKAAKVFVEGERLGQVIVS